MMSRQVITGLLSRRTLGGYRAALTNEIWMRGSVLVKSARCKCLVTLLDPVYVSLLCLGLIHHYMNDVFKLYRAYCISVSLSCMPGFTVY
jgi:hypothetical protein